MRRGQKCLYTPTISYFFLLILKIARSFEQTAQSIIEKIIICCVYQHHTWFDNDQWAVYQFMGIKISFIHDTYLYIASRVPQLKRFLRIFGVDSMLVHGKDSRKLNAAIPAMRTRFLFWNVNIHRHRHRHTCMRDRAMGRHHFGFYVCVCVKNQKPSTMCQNSAPKISVYRFCCVCINIHKCV